MPALTRAFLRAGLLWLVAGLGLLAVLAVWPGRLSPLLRPAAFHFITVGWLTQMIFGVAHWMFPRANRQHPRGSETLGWAAFGGLNLGLLLRGATESVPSPGTAGQLLALAGLLQLAAALAWVIHIWPRVKER
jgi:hypothetical protein